MLVYQTSANGQGLGLLESVDGLVFEGDSGHGVDKLGDVWA